MSCLASLAGWTICSPCARLRWNGASGGHRQRVRLEGESLACPDAMVGQEPKVAADVVAHAATLMGPPVAMAAPDSMPAAGEISYAVEGAQAVEEVMELTWFVHSPYTTHVSRVGESWVVPPCVGARRVR
jgi:hypothetical protein